MPHAFDPDFIAPTRHTDPPVPCTRCSASTSSSDHLRHAMHDFVAGQTPTGPVRAFYPFVRVHTTTVARSPANWPMDSSKGRAF